MKRGACFLLALLAACGAETHNPASSKAAEAVTTTAQKDGVTLTVALAPKHPRLSDEPKLTVTVEAPGDTDVTLPPFGKSMGGFSILDYHESMPKQVGRTTVRRQVYTLDPDGAGERIVWPIAVAFKRAGGKKETVESDALHVDVVAPDAGKGVRLADLKGPAPPVDLPGGGLGPWPFVGLACLLGAAAGAYAWRRRKKPRAVPEPTPSEKAAAELAALLAADPREGGDFQSFYVELTAVVRRYIERTQGLRAPEQTTDEFLAEVRRRPELFPAEERRRLFAFLEAADLVKFAAQRPSMEETDAAVRRAKEFCGLSAPAEAAA